MLQTVLLVSNTLVAFTLILLVLAQKGRGSDMMAPGGASQTFFGSQGSGSFITRLTGIIAFLFFAINLSLHVLSTRQMKQTESILASASHKPPNHSK